MQGRVIFEIGVHGPFQVLEGYLLIIKDQFFDDQQGIRDVRQTDAGCAGAVVAGAAPGNVPAFAMQSSIREDSSGVGRITWWARASISLYWMD